ncbi:hypothetical protein [Methylococcus mesophilus]|uniref:hypothetical protein n=1 Tax=Methylococcus mesophilus TaxID=2993564 RepID=UPI00224AC98F|nr:hypothetical protein [Methylococcus mesophilus]UZR29566.1 hypothetical protein OOT43_02755 [Methylococcus mesophilus]
MMIRFASGGDCGGSSACAGDAFDEVHRLTLPNSNNALHKTIKNKYEYFYSYVVARIAPEPVAAPTPLFPYCCQDSSAVPRNV